MAAGVQQHPPGLAGLRVGHGRAQLDARSLRGVEVVNGQGSVVVAWDEATPEVGED